MAEIVNLRTVRKRKARVAKDDRAAQNRAKFGATKSAKLKKAAEDALAVARLDGHKRDDECAP